MFDFDRQIERYVRAGARNVACSVRFHSRVAEMKSLFMQHCSPVSVFLCCETDFLLRQLDP